MQPAPSPASLTVDSVTVQLGQALILDDVTLAVPAGQFTCLLGPSGCGKTTLLRAIAGFVPVAAGDIRIGDRSIAALPPERRDTAMVFQSYALWPHMNVADNLAYPLKLRGIGARERRERVARILHLLELEGFERRAIASLSGGQKQRIALGRALIVDPPVLLLDEPLSNLDAAIRRSLRTELRQLQRRLGITTIMVTHDQEEALSMADTVVLMRDGRISQVAAPESLYAAPVDIAAARFLGVDNLVARQEGDPVETGAAVTLGFRSRHARLAARALDGHLARPVRVLDCAYAGDGYHLLLDAEGERLTALSDTHHPIGATAVAVVPKAALIAFGANSHRVPVSTH